MPSYSSKSQKRSKSQSKNGGRRRKRTLKNVRRRKSRKVMMGGGLYEDISNNTDAYNYVQGIMGNVPNPLTKQQLEEKGVNIMKLKTYGVTVI